MEDVSEIESAGTSGGPHYALVEDGTFHNDIERPVTITGQKLWSHLPARVSGSRSSVGNVYIV